jgi:hypothetical protein
MLSMGTLILIGAGDLDTGQVQRLFEDGRIHALGEAKPRVQSSAALLRFEV